MGASRMQGRAGTKRSEADFTAVISHIAGSGQHAVIGLARPIARLPRLEYKLRRDLHNPGVLSAQDLAKLGAITTRDRSIQASAVRQIEGLAAELQDHSFADPEGARECRIQFEKRGTR